MAVTGRQLWYVYFASHAAIAASAIAMFSNAKRRAFCSRVFPTAALTSWAMLFQCPGGVSVPPPSAQNNAICVWSAVRAEFTAAPSALTSLKAAVHSALLRAGGPGGRNCVERLIAKGVTIPH